MKNIYFGFFQSKFKNFLCIAGLFLLFINVFPNSTVAEDQTILGTLSLSKNTAYLSGDTIVATVVDVDRNTSTTSANTLTTALKLMGSNYSVGTDLYLNIVETGVNTSTFVATFKTGTTTETGTTPQIVKAIQGGILNVIYTDISPSLSAATKSLSLTSFNATMDFDADFYPLGFYAVVTLADAERNANNTVVESLLSDVFIQTSEDNSTKVRMTETSADTGTFVGSIQVASTGGTSEFSLIQVSVGDTLSITYIDEVNTTGSSRTVTDTASVTAEGTGQPPTVTTDSATNITLNSATLSGTVNTHGWTTTAWFEYGVTSGSYTSTSSTQNINGLSDIMVSTDISGLSSGTTYYYRLVAQNSAGTAYGSEMSFTTTDTTSPTGSISINSNATYSNSTTVTLTLSASDDVGITDYYISTDSTTPSTSGSGWTTITSTTSYTEDISYTLSSGDGGKTIYVWYKDGSENISSSANDSITLDTIQPTIIITSPTSSATYTSTSNVVNLDGVAFDSTSGISSVRWVNSNGESGTATGTTSWSISNVSLLSGDNAITVTALDGAENTSTDTITVTYSQPTPTQTPTPIPSPSPTVTLLPSPTPNEKGSISGYVIDRRDNPIESAKIRLKGTNSKVLEKTTSDEDGVFEFADLDADTYTITALKKGYKTVKQSITLEEGEEADIEIVMKKSSRRIAFVEH